MTAVLNSRRLRLTERPRMWVAISLSSAERNSAATLCSDNVGDKGVGAVIGLVRQIHSYERSPNLRWPKADVEAGIRVVFFKLAPSLCSPLRPAVKTQRSSYAIQRP